MLKSDGFAVLRLFAVLPAVALLAILAAACDGGGDGGGTTPQTDETPAVGETPAADGGDEGDGSGDGGLADLEALASVAAGEVTAKVTYEFTSEADGEAIKVEWVLVQRPPDSRFEFASTEGGEEVRTIIINAGGQSYICTSAGGQENCLASEATETVAQTALLDPLFDVPRELSEGASDVGLVDRAQRTIAGVDATCFTVSGGLVALGEGEMCFSDEGLLLLLRSEAAGASFTFEATSVSTDVTDSDFEPPYDIFELPGLNLPGE